MTLLRCLNEIYSVILIKNCWLLLCFRI